ncbi:hypothetical protein [Pontibacter ruber]|uniref:VCBS repeat-containing protein n=1 Tax=Pontibacter ruber TaxID=1343895 RepID=A0ABW5D0Y1_9BACT|nr:hypothetical protein [Pontibacter ruber]
MLLGTLLVGACQPKNEEVKREQVNPRELEAATDSVANTNKDGTATTHTFNDPDFVLPQPVMQYLAAHYAGWEKPMLSAEASRQPEETTQGPFVLNGDFNGDGQQDQVFQLQHKNKVLILATWQQQNGKIAAQELEQQKLPNQAGEFKSLYTLSLIKAGSKLQHIKTKAVTTAPHDAVAVALPDRETIYAWDGTTFSAYTSADAD